MMLLGAKCSSGIVSTSIYGIFSVISIGGASAQCFIPQVMEPSSGSTLSSNVKLGLGLVLTIISFQFSYVSAVDWERIRKILKEENFNGTLPPPGPEYDRLFNKTMTEFKKDKEFYEYINKKMAKKTDSDRSINMLKEYQAFMNLPSITPIPTAKTSEPMRFTRSRKPRKSYRFKESEYSYANTDASELVSEALKSITSGGSGKHISSFTVVSLESDSVLGHTSSSWEKNKSKGDDSKKKDIKSRKKSKKKKSKSKRRRRRRRKREESNSLTSSSSSSSSNTCASSLVSSALKSITSGGSGEHISSFTVVSQESDSVLGHTSSSWERDEAKKNGSKVRRQKEESSSSSSSSNTKVISLTSTEHTSDPRGSVMPKSLRNIPYVTPLSRKKRAITLKNRLKKLKKKYKVKSLDTKEALKGNFISRSKAGPAKKSKEDSKFRRFKKKYKVKSLDTKEALKGNFISRSKAGPAKKSKKDSKFRRLKKKYKVKSLEKKEALRGNFVSKDSLPKDFLDRSRDRTKEEKAIKRLMKRNEKQMMKDYSIAGTQPKPESESSKSSRSSGTYVEESISHDIDKAIKRRQNEDRKYDRSLPSLDSSFSYIYSDSNGPRPLIPSVSSLDMSKTPGSSSISSVPFEPPSSSSSSSSSSSGSSSSSFSTSSSSSWSKETESSESAKPAASIYDPKTLPKKQRRDLKKANAYLNDLIQKKIDEKSKMVNDIISEIDPTKRRKWMPKDTYKSDS